MALNDVRVTKLNGGLGRREPLTDAYSGMLIMGKETGLSVGYGEVNRLNSISDAVDLGFSEDNDLSNEAIMYFHIKEFFRINPNGTLWLMIVPISNSVEFNDYLELENDYSVKRIVDAAEGKIHQIAVGFGQLDGQVIDYYAAVESAVLKAQQAADYFYSHHQPVIFIIDGFGFNTLAGVESLSDLRDLNSPSVSVVVSNYTEAKEVSGTSANSTAIGTFLGLISLAKVNECIAWIQKFNVFGDGLTRALIFKEPIEELSNSELFELNEFGYLFFRTHTGIAGIYANDSHSATAITSDYAYIENNRTINKATRIIRSTLLPYLNGPVPVNPTTGKLAAEFVKNLEALGNRAIDELMFKNGELSGFSFEIDENQNILSTSLLDTALTLIPTGTARNINVNIGFTNPFNS